MIKFEDVKRTKSLGKLSGDGIGIAVNIKAEVTSAEYAKDSEGKVKASKAGNKQVKLNCRIEKEITKDDGGKLKIPSFFNVIYYETEFSPSLKDIKPSDKLKKYAEIKFNTGGEGKEDKGVFGFFKVRNYEGQDGFPKNSISIKGGNIQQAIKKEGVYIIKDFDKNDITFTLDTDINVSLKGFIEDIKDTEKFIKDNYNEKTKSLKFKMYYLENEGEAEYDITMPCILENIEKDRVFKFIEFVKKLEGTVVGIKGHIKSSPIYGETSDDSDGEFGEYSYGGFEVIGYEAGLVVEFDTEKNNWIISKTKNTGKIILGESVAEIKSSEDDIVF